MTDGQSEACEFAKMPTEPRRITLPTREWPPKIETAVACALLAISDIEQQTDRDVRKFSYDPATGKVEITFEPMGYETTTEIIANTGR